MPSFACVANKTNEEVFLRQILRFRTPVGEAIIPVTVEGLLSLGIVWVGGVLTAQINKSPSNERLNCKTYLISNFPLQASICIEEDNLDTMRGVENLFSATPCVSDVSAVNGEVFFSIDAVGCFDYEFKSVGLNGFQVEVAKKTDSKDCSLRIGLFTDTNDIWLSKDMSLGNVVNIFANLI